jgi:RNA polymerase sigma-70 factor (ECF subfamily)
MSPNPGTTNPVLLSRLSDWRDHPAWGEFFARYTPLVQSRCRRLGLVDDAADEAAQWIWIGLSQRLPTFRYDPDGSFRAWLRRYCDSRLIDRYRARGPAREVALDEAFGAEGPAASVDEDISEDGESPAAARPQLLSLAADVHARVRTQVQPDTWRAFWLVAVEDRSIREAAETLGRTYASTFAAQSRVRHLLREEGRRVLEQPASSGSVREGER